MSIPSSVADESMFADDKSEGIYIRTENWCDDYSENNSGKDYGRRNSEYRSRRFDRGENHSFRSEKFARHDKGRYADRSRKIETSAEELKQLIIRADVECVLFHNKFAEVCRRISEKSFFIYRKKICRAKEEFWFF